MLPEVAVEGLWPPGSNNSAQESDVEGCGEGFGRVDNSFAD